MNSGKSKTAYTVSFCGVTAALSVIILIIGAALGVMTYAAPLAASACLIPVILELGNIPALLVYAASGILAVLLCADKETAFFYVFIGFYPIIRPYFSRIGVKPLRIAAKLALFMVSMGMMYALLYFVLGLEQFKSELASMGIALNIGLFALLVLTLLIFDFVLVLTERLYLTRIRPKLKFIRRV